MPVREGKGLSLAIVAVLAGAMVMPACDVEDRSGRLAHTDDSERDGKSSGNGGPVEHEVTLGRDRAEARVSLSDVLTLGGSASGWVDLAEQSDEIDADEAAARKHATEHIDPLSHFHELYPDAIGYFDEYERGWVDASACLTWYSRTWFYDRYELTLEMRVGLSEDGRRIARTEDVRFYLVEYRRIVEGPGGKPLPQAGRLGVFGDDRWEKLKEADGRVEAVFDGVKTDEPVEDFQAYVDHQRTIHDQGVQIADDTQTEDENAEAEEQEDPTPDDE